jgi:C-terminal processing protease CtpA/Prc
MNTRIKKWLIRLGPSVVVAAAFSAWFFYQAQPADLGSPPSEPAHQVSAGENAYRHAFGAYNTTFRLLADPGQAEQFAKDWEHRFDQTGELDTMDGAKSAILRMAKVGDLLGCPEQFDGNCLFERAKRAYLRIHYGLGVAGSPDLTDPKQREAWLTLIDGSIDKKLLETEEGTYAAIRQMRDTLGKPFDYVHSPVMTKAEVREREAQFPGIGVPVEVTNLGKNKLGGQFHLFFGRPLPNNQLAGKVNLGDVILAVNGQNLDNMTIDDAKTLIVGKAGDHVKLKLQRDQASEPFEVEAVLQCLPGVFQCPGEATVGVEVGVTHQKELKLSSFSQMRAHAPSDGSPARGKIFEGDLFIGADGQSFDGLTLREAVDKIHGAVNTPVVLKVLRKNASGETETLDVTIVRKVIEEHAVHFTALPGDIGLIEIDQFSSLNVTADSAAAIARTVLPLAQKALEGATDEESKRLAEQFGNLKTKLDRGELLDATSMRLAMKARDVYDEKGQGGGVIIDLSRNPGGSTDVVFDFAGLVLPEGLVVAIHERELGTDRVIVQEESLSTDFAFTAERPLGYGLERAKISPRPRLPLLLPKKMPLKVLVGPRTASAAELTAGMLQAHKRAALIGETLPVEEGKEVHRPSTLGKGSGQAQILLAYGYSLHVTDMEFYPGGVRSNGRGLIADLDAANQALQRDLAVAEIKKDNLVIAAHEADLKAAAARSKALTDGLMSDRWNEDRKPLGDQNPEMFK